MALENQVSTSLENEVVAGAKSSEALPKAGKIVWDTAVSALTPVRTVLTGVGGFLTSTAGMVAAGTVAVVASVMGASAWYGKRERDNEKYAAQQAQASVELQQNIAANRTKIQEMSSELGQFNRIGGNFRETVRPLAGVNVQQPELPDGILPQPDISQ